MFFPPRNLGYLQRALRLALVRLWWDGGTSLIAAFVQKTIAFPLLLLWEVLSTHLAEFTG